MNIFICLAYWYYHITFLQFLLVDVVNFDLYFWTEQGYSVVLPEKLQTGKWNVYRYTSSIVLDLDFLFIILEPNLSLILFSILYGRSVRSPLQLVSKFPNHPEIGTLHENFVWASILFICKISSELKKIDK